MLNTRQTIRPVSWMPPPGDKLSQNQPKTDLVVSSAQNIARTANSDYSFSCVVAVD